jgi:hypothetical protein
MDSPSRELAKESCPLSKSQSEKPKETSDFLDKENKDFFIQLRDRITEAKSRRSK